MAAFAACTNSGDKYVINGQVEGLEDGTVVTLVPMSHDNDSALAEATIQEGKFQLTGVASEPICARVSVKGAYGGPFVVLEKKEYTHIFEELLKECLFIPEMNTKENLLRLIRSKYI